MPENLTSQYLDNLACTMGVKKKWTHRGQILICSIGHRSPPLTYFIAYSISKAIKEWILNEHKVGDGNEIK